MKRSIFVLTSILTAAVFLSWSEFAIAHDTYQSTSGAGDNCSVCHPGFVGGFAGPLHGLHLTMTGDCQLCHDVAGSTPVYTSTSPGGLNNLGCAGCHEEFGLRAHHTNAGAPPDPSGLSCADCHPTDPSAPAENIVDSNVRAYYLRADVTVNDPCNSDLSEDVDGNGEGLDNDGDLAYDAADPDCASNHPPVSDPNGPYTGTAGAAVQFDGTGSSDPDGTLIAYDWDYGDGNAGTGPTPTHTYASAGLYTVTLTVTDDAGAADTATTTADISAIVNEPPVADPNGPYAGTAGAAVQFDGTGSFDPDGTLVAYDWDYGDGATGTGPTPTHTYASAGLYTVTLTVTDEAGVTDTASTTAQIHEQCIADPKTQGYWHRQCLGVPQSEGGLDPGRKGRGPKETTEPDFVQEIMPCADQLLEDLGFFGELTCSGIDADPPSDPCERAVRQLTALLLNICSERLVEACEVDLSTTQCAATTVLDFIDEASTLIHSGECKIAADCAALVNEGEGLVNHENGD